MLPILYIGSCHITFKMLSLSVIFEVELYHTIGTYQTLKTIMNNMTIIL